jgi:outer membrane lipoprotein-sorting protein
MYKKNKCMKKLIFSMIGIVGLSLGLSAQTPSALDIVTKADAKMRGNSSYMEMTMQIVRPKYTREISLKSWSKGDNLSLVKITAPAKDAGQGYLKINKDLWNWLPSIERMVKMSASVLGQSWMGSDFTNDDMVKQSSMVTDYTSKIMAEEQIRAFSCWKIELTPKQNAAVVWGKIIIWIDKDYNIIKTQYYDEDSILVQTMENFDFKTFGDRQMPSRMEISPADKKGQKTVVIVSKAQYNQPLNDNFFSQQNLKTIK